MKDTEVIRILNDLAKDAMGDLKKKICGHIDAILDRMEKEKRQQMDDLVDALRCAPIQAKNDAAAPKVERIPAENAQKPEQNVKSPPEKPSGGGAGEDRHRKAAGAAEGRLGSEEDRGRDEVLRGDDLQLHEEGRH